MREVDCGALARYLTPSKAKLESKGVKSVASRVSNLKDLNSDITHEGVRSVPHTGLRMACLVAWQQRLQGSCMNGHSC